MKDQAPDAPLVVLDGECAGSGMCPLSDIKAGTTVCIKQLFTSPEVSGRLREMGLIEERHVRLVARQATFICQVCNARLGLSEKLAQAIMVKAVPSQTKAGGDRK